MDCVAGRRFVKTAISFTPQIQRDKIASTSYQYQWGTKVTSQLRVSNCERLCVFVSVHVVWYVCLCMFVFFVLCLCLYITFMFVYECICIFDCVCVHARTHACVRVCVLIISLQLSKHEQLIVFFYFLRECVK